ncbi:helix-turn-helix domain-containing protein [Umezawaea sp. NPDC059074]|uniref:helix-turn-helix domain-containing protein n=1 Tax=Umezawaea sp. NPDC059074 TaxID=3346716 RepID=UPI0036B0B13B
MADPAHEIGKRVRYWRLRRNIGRKQFADMVGRSTSWLDKIETGERHLVRLPTLELVADALGIDPTVLTDAPAAERASACVDPTEVLAIRSALGSYPALGRQAAAPVVLANLQRQADYLDHAWTASHFTTVAQHLPTLLGDAQRAVSTAPQSEAVEAYRVLVTTYRLASSMLLKFESNDIAWLAADRAIHTALAVNDTWSLARATRSLARAMTSVQQPSEAISALQTMADGMRAEVANDEEHLLSLMGMLFLAASITAAEQENASLALAMHEQASQAAEQMQRHYRTHHTYFGRTNVAVHRVAALVRLHDSQASLRYAETIPPEAIAGLSPERRASFLLDLTEAKIMCGDYRDAARLLSQVEHTAPQEVRCRPLAHSLLRLLLANTTGEPGRMVKQMAERAGVPA